MMAYRQALCTVMVQLGRMTRHHRANHLVVSGFEVNKVVQTINMTLTTYGEAGDLRKSAQY
jgi:hypothetical protein